MNLNQMFQKSSLPGLAGAFLFSLLVILAVASLALAGSSVADGQPTADRIPSANDSPNTLSFSLSVIRDGTGRGDVTSDPKGVECGLKCEQFFEAKTLVTLTATPGDGSVLAGWQGCDAVTKDNRCEVRMDAARTVTVFFEATGPPTHLLTIAKSGSGLVTSSPAGINCGPTCVAEFAEGTVVTLSARPGRQNTLAGWQDCDAVTSDGDCVVKVTAARSATVTFARTPGPPTSPKPSTPVKPPTSQACRKTTLTLGGVRLNHLSGTARLLARVGAPGNVTLRGSARVRPVTVRAPRAGTVRLPVRARGQALRKLVRGGSAKVGVTVVYRPRVACPVQRRSRTVRLIRRP